MEFDDATIEAAIKAAQSEQSRWKLHAQAPGGGNSYVIHDGSERPIKYSSQDYKEAERVFKDMRGKAAMRVALNAALELMVAA